MKDFKFIDITDLPSDPSGTLGKFRTDLLKAYNFNRRSPEKLKLLVNTLAAVVAAINDGMETPDSIDTEAFRRYQIDKEINNTDCSSGFTPIEPTKTKPKRAAKRTPTTRAKRTGK